MRVEKRQVCILFCLILCVFNYLLLYSMEENTSNTLLFDVIERLERNIKHSFLHNLQQELSSKSIYLPNNAEQNKKIFWIHIPRTSGNSIRTDLIGKNADWLIDYSFWKRENVPFNINGGKRSAKTIYREWSNKTKIVIKGWFSWRDVDQYKGLGHEQKKIFTIIRYPTERIYSLYKRLTKYGNDQKEQCKLVQSLFDNISDDKSQCISLTEFLDAKSCRLQSLISNYVTWQIADRVKIKGCNEMNESLNQIQFERAKMNLDKMDFIGFYEDMYHDFELLHENIFSEVENTFFLRNIFNFGTLIALPRMRVLKYSNMISKEDLALIEEKNKYDIKLYEYAKLKMNKTFKLYASYSQFVSQWG